MTEVGQASLASIAKKQLGLSSDAVIPQFYINELRTHLRLHPNENNFRVILEPNVGFGSVICLKDRCNKTIPLIKRGRSSNGGKKDGFGSLSAYRTHLSEHQASAWLMHAGAMNKAIPKKVVKPPSEVAVVAPSSLSSTLSASTASDSGPASGTAQVKVEKSGPTSSRKRTSDSAFAPEIRNSASAPPAERQVYKKLKSDVATKNPLSQVTNKPTPTPTTSKDRMYSSFDLPQDPLFVLDNVHVAIVGQQHLVQTLRANRFGSLEDLQNLQSAEDELQRLNALEQSYQMTLFGMPSSSSNPFTENLSNAFQPTFSFDDNFMQEASSVSQRYPMDLDASFVPSNPNIAFAPFPAEPSVVDSSHSFVPKVSIDHNIVGKEHAAPPLSTFVDQPLVPQASSSKQHLAVTTQAVAPMSLPKKTGQTYDKLQASSLNALPDPVYQGSTSEDESSDDDWSDGDNALDTTKFLDRLGLRTPLPVLNNVVDANGDYYGRGRDLFDGPRASHDEGVFSRLEKFLIQAGNAEVFDGNERVEDALKHLGLKSLNDIIPGMEVPLMAHQAMGVTWMLEKECSYYKGGCLADEMGLGKTVQMIATIVKNKPTNPTCKTTLIVAPLALLDQWKTEIETKTNCGLTCLVYHGPSKPTSKKILLQYDIVLTTFSTLAREWPDFETQMKQKKKAKKNGDDFIVSDEDEDMKDFTYRSQKRKETAGLLFQVEFFRTVLDEAQYIRNRRTRTSRALTDIQATYRWCLTGTPIVNTLVDAYGYLRFLKIRPWYDWNEFSARIARHERKRPDLAITRLHAIMSTFLLRRQKNTKLDGKPIVKLPEKEIKFVKLEFSKEERDVYKMVEARNQAVFNRYLREGTVLKNYHHVLALLLRLRQICSHASLIAEEGSAFVQHQEFDEDFKIEFSNELTRARRIVSEAFVAKLKEKFKREALARMEAEKASTNATIEEEDCPICFDAMTDAVVTACGHIFCRECIINFINMRAPDEAGEVVDRGCPCCREPLDTKKLFSRCAFEPTDKELNPISAPDSDVEITSDDNFIPNRRKGKGKASRAGNRRKLPAHSEDEDDDMTDFIVESDEDEDEKDARRAIKTHLGKKRAHVILDSDDEADTPEERGVLLGVPDKNISNEAFEHLRFLPSSKMKYMMDELDRLSKTKPDEKTLVVSQWTSCLELVSKYLAEQGIPHVKYQGDMDRTKRDQAVKVFMSKEKARVMLMSLKCGGVGLNLTRANNVISLDLGWSFAVESQAFDRVHRVGQMRRVLVRRVVIADTVEDRILQMQERKKTFADGVLGEGSAKKLGRLSVKELANLFGLDARGRVLKD